MPEEEIPEGNAFGKRVRELRLQRRRSGRREFSLRQFAVRAGISPTFLCKIETGGLAPPIAPKIVRIAELLECNEDELLALAGKVSPEVTRIICERPRIYTDILRAARLMSEEQIRTVRQVVRHMVGKGGAGDRKGG